MNKRIALKTALICSGLFIILISIAAYYLFTNYPLDTEGRTQTIIAAADIKTGEVITSEMLATVNIRESAVTEDMQRDKKESIGSKALYPVKAGEYLQKSGLIKKQDWSGDNDRIIVLSMDIESRLANLVKKGSFIDIRVIPNENKLLLKTVISKIIVEDILDENGLSLGESLGNKKGFAVLKVTPEQSSRMNAAVQLGKLIFELYCDNTQVKVEEDFVIPEAFPVTNIQINSQQGSTKTIPQPEGRK